MSKRILIACAAIVLLSPLSASAQFYVGGSMGNTFTGHEATDAANQVTKIDENSTGFKFFAGNAGKSFLGVEGGYRNLGKVDGLVSGSTFSTQTSGFDIEALGRFKLAMVDIFGKAGAFFWKTDTFVGTDTNDDDGVALLWGVGASVHLGTIGVRLEWESMEVKTPDSLSLVSLGVTLGY